MFWSVVGTSGVASVCLFAAIYAYWRYFPHTRHQRRVNDLKALRDLLLYHVDDLEDILEALQKRPELTTGDSIAQREQAAWCLDGMAIMLCISDLLHSTSKYFKHCAA